MTFHITGAGSIRGLSSATQAIAQDSPNGDLLWEIIPQPSSETEVRLTPLGSVFRAAKQTPKRDTSFELRAVRGGSYPLYVMTDGRRSPIITAGDAGVIKYEADAGRLVPSLGISPRAVAETAKQLSLH